MCSVGYTVGICQCSSFREFLVKRALLFLSCAKGGMEDFDGECFENEYIYSLICVCLKYNVLYVWWIFMAVCGYCVSLECFNMQVWVSYV